jgi:hypothetical protein
MSGYHKYSRAGYREWSYLGWAGLAGLMMVMYVAVTPTAAENAKHQESDKVGLQYDSSTSYTGIFKSDQLYRRNPDLGSWRGSKRLSHLKQVICPKAKETLSENGLWKGHLNTDGSCGSSAEPAEWALGNFLNYQDEFSSAMETETP